MSIYVHISTCIWGVCVCIKRLYHYVYETVAAAAADAAEDARLWKTRRRRGGGGHGVFNICLKAVRKR